MIYECHGHIMLNGLNYNEAALRNQNGVDEAFLRQNLKTCADFGIEFYRDGGDYLMVSAFAKKIAWEFGIDYRSPIFAIHKKGCYGSMFGREYECMSEFATLVREAKTLGADFIKLMVSGILDFSNEGAVSEPSIGADELFKAVNIASSEGLAVMAHVNSTENMKNALAAGVKSIEHGFWPDREVIDYFLQTGAVWVPTRAPLKNLIGKGIFSNILLQNILDHQEKVLKAAFKAGVPIASGSDSGALQVWQGSGTLDEYRYLSEIGINPDQGNSLISDIFRMI